MGGGPIGIGGWNLSRSMGRRTLSSRTGVSPPTSPTSPPSWRKTHHHHNNNLPSPHPHPHSHPLSVSTSTSAFVVSPNPPSRAVGTFLTCTCDHDAGYDVDWFCLSGFESEDLGGGYYFDDFALGFQGRGRERPSYRSEGVQNYGPERVIEAFDMLRSDPSVQKMVLSLSSDKAVWEAVLNNEVVKELMDSDKRAEAAQCPTEMLDSPDKSTAETNTVLNALRCVFDNTRVKVLQMIEIISKIIGQMIHPVDENGQAGSFDPFEEKL